MNSKTDNIFATKKVASPFTFDNHVAEVFPDMIKRSVPGYSDIIHTIGKFAGQFVTENSQCFDLGCSLGAASLAMSHGIQNTQLNKDTIKIIAVDNSLAMLQRCQQHINAFKHEVAIELVNDDIQKISINNASMAVLNFTLQFIPRQERAPLLKQIYTGLNPGGILVLSEKVCFEDKTIDHLIIELHHQFKKDNGYSELEVSQKRNALENVLLPESLNNHISRLKEIGFSSVCCWMQQYNFVSILAIK